MSLQNDAAGDLLMIHQPNFPALWPISLVSSMAGGFLYLGEFVSAMGGTNLKGIVVLSYATEIRSK